MQKRTIMSGTTTYYENESEMQYVQFDSNEVSPLLPRRDFKALVSRLKQGSLLIKPIHGGKHQHSRAVTLMRTRHMCLSLGIDNRLRLTGSTSFENVNYLSLYIVEEIPQVLAFLADYAEKLNAIKG